MAPVIWYREPAERWFWGLPVGNGRLGAMVWGGVGDERLTLDESGFWSGEASTDNCPTGAPAVLARMREQLFRGEYRAAEDLGRTIVGRRLNYGTHLPFGTLWIHTTHPAGGATEYRRELDLSRGIAGVSYLAGGVRYRREVLASHPDQVVAVRIECDAKAGLSVRISLDGGHQPFASRPWGDDTILMDGQAREVSHSDGKTGVSSHARIRVIADRGSLRARSGSESRRTEVTEVSPADWSLGPAAGARGQLEVDRADAVTILVALGTSWGGADPEATCRRHIEAAWPRPYVELRERAVADHRRYFDRVSLELGAAEDRSTDERIAAVKRGESDPGLAALLFNFGRYLLIGSSRPDSQLPAHLTGVWNDNVACRIGWSCDMHLDINTEMNYWIAELTNLSDCHAPLFRWIRERLVPSGRVTAERMYGAPGWVAHIVSNAWGFSAPGWSTWWGFHPTGGLWVATHLWEHFRFTGDRAFLRDEAYPVLREAALFFLGYLTEDPGGRLVTGPSISPENGFAVGGGTCSLDMGPTVDSVLVNELFGAVAESSRILGLDADLRDRVETARVRLSPLQVGKHGQLQEWLTDHEEALPGHRHTSHLLSLYPFDQVTPGETPELARAARVSVERREAAPGGFEEGAWARNNLTCFYARLGDGEAALRSLLTQFRLGSDGSLMVGCILLPRILAYEMDYNTGATAAVTEMLMQSHRGRIALLPALPAAWREGRVAGLCARGGFEVDIEWAAGRLTEARVRSRLGGLCRVRAAGALLVSREAEAVPVSAGAKGEWEFLTERGAEYVLRTDPAGGR